MPSTCEAPAEAEGRCQALHCGVPPLHMLHRLSAPTPLRLCARASSLVKPAPFVVKNFSITPLLKNMSDTKSTDMLAKLFQRSHVPDMTGRPFIRTAA